MKHRLLVRNAVLIGLLAGVGLPTSCKQQPQKLRPLPSSSVTIGRQLGQPPLAQASGVTELARQFCETLHVLPAERRSECCGGRATQPLFGACLSAITASVQAGAVTLNPSQLSACRAASQRAFVGCDWVTVSGPLSPPECEEVLEGQLQEGARCRSSLECKVPLHCEGAGPGKTGSCRPPNAAGASCGTEVDALAAYTAARHLEHRHPICEEFCSLTRHKCEPKPQPGAACVASVNCAADQACSQGQCQSRRVSGLGEPCASASCESGSRCLENRCSALAAAGEACQRDGDCARGACVTSAEGQRICGGQCFATLDALRALDATKLRLPVRALSAAAR